MCGIACLAETNVLVLRMHRCVPFRHDLYMKVVSKELSPYLFHVSFVVKLLTLFTLNVLKVCYLPYHGSLPVLASQFTAGDTAVCILHTK
jgi:hypothetical protein